MRPDPDTLDLLRLASTEMSEKILPELSGDTRYAAHLVRRAIEVAVEEIAAERNAPAGAQDALKLQADIQNGAYDEDPRAALRRLSKRHS